MHNKETNYSLLSTRAWTNLKVPCTILMALQVYINDNTILTINSYLSCNKAERKILISLLTLLMSLTVVLNIASNFNSFVMTLGGSVSYHEYTDPSSRSCVVKTSKADSIHDLCCASWCGRGFAENYYSININLGPSLRHTFHVDVSIMHAPGPTLCPVSPLPPNRS